MDFIINYGTHRHSIINKLFEIKKELNRYITLETKGREGKHLFQRSRAFAPFQT